MYDTSSSPQCKSTMEANITMDVLLKIFNDLPFGCLIPCNQTVFNLDYTLFNQNSDMIIFDKENEDKINEIFPELIVSIYYHTLSVEEHSETVVYDSINFLSAAGGNLGLLLGFSCLSTLLYFYDFVINKLFSK